MNSDTHRPIRKCLWITGIATGLHLAPAHACDDWLARTVAVSGAVEWQTTAGHWQPLAVTQTLCAGDDVRVAANSRAALYLRNNTYMRLAENSVVHFPEARNDKDFWLDVRQGLAHFISRIVNRFEVGTPYVNAVVEGTEFVVGANTTQSSVAVIEGQVNTWNDASRMQLTAGQQVSASTRAGVLTRIDIAPATTVAWAIYYPPVLTINNLQPSDPWEQQQLAALMPLLQQQRPDLALQQLESAPATPTLAVTRAALLLAVGRIADADAQLATLQQNQTAPAYALQAIADAARNRPDSALRAAGMAVQRAPDQAASHLALSYARQSALQLDGALAAAREATRVEPDNTLAWLRLTELQLNQGDITAARKALAHVDRARPRAASEQAMILNAQGFIALFSLHLQEARQAFEQALQQNSGDPQSHLGLGLAMLRAGQLAEGRQHLEYAVSMDPLHSTLRSYLGRAYFEEKREKEALTQWQLAKQFDPNDPTPHFYTGVDKLLANQPVDAIDELETARELNHKRAIYRAETLLQSDAASRSATLARAYHETGYEQGVLLNGWDALRSDPSNAEGHRLLADKYASDSRFEAARASELLQSQLWQPLSSYPLQPQLGETGIAVVEGSGPQRPSLNEFHSLFMQNGTHLTAGGYAGSDGTWADDLVGSLLTGPFAVSLGQYHYTTDGWRDNADQTQDVYNGFMQWQITPATSVQVEHRELNHDTGYLPATLSETGNASSAEETDRTTDRFGASHRFADAGALLFSLIRQRLTTDALLTQDTGPTDTHIDAESVSGEVQWIHTAGPHQWQLGGGIFDTESQDQFAQDFNVDLGGSLYQLRVQRDTEESPSITTEYAHYYYALNPDTDLGIGLEHTDTTFDDQATETQTEYIDGFEISSTPEASDQDRPDRSRWLPGVGAAYRASSSAQFRAAAFSTIAKRTVIGQSIAPTSLFGFNKVYDDPEGAETRNYGVAADFSADDLHYGATLITRRLRAPFEGVTSTEFLDQTQDIVDLYANLQASRRVTTSLWADWTHKQLDSDTLVNSTIDDLRQLRIPFEVILFSGDALSLRLTETWYRQEADTNTADDSDRMQGWVSDAALQYRFAKRRGSLVLGIENATDNNDEFLSFSENELAFYPGRFWYAAITANF